MRVSLPNVALLFVMALTPLGCLVTSEVMAQDPCQPAGNWADCAQEQPACGLGGTCGAPADCAPRWSFVGEAIALQRIPTRDQPLFTNFQTTLGSDPLNARNLNSSVSPGYELSAIRHNAWRCYDVEIRYFQIDGFTAHADLPGTSYMVTDANQTGFLVTDAHARYTSALYNGELNVRQECLDGVTIVAGFRMAKLNEQYLANGTEAFLPSRTDSINASTYNHLYGFQLGADVLAYDMGGPLQIKALCRAGIFDNFAHQNYQRVSNDGGSIIVDDAYGAHRDQASFLGEAGVVATYAITERLAFRASAEAIWITGVALAPEQLSGMNLRTQVDTINTSGAVFYYGGGLGLEYRF